MAIPVGSILVERLLTKVVKRMVSLTKQVNMTGAGRPEAGAKLLSTQWLLMDIILGWDVVTTRLSRSSPRWRNS